MTKVEVDAHELRNGNIEKISLVTNGAIRQPFKILKTEEMDSAKTGGIRGTINKIFGQSDEDSRIAALFVRKDAAKAMLPVIRKNGFRVEKEHAELMGEVLVLKQEGFDPDAELPVIALNTDLAVQLGSVSKFFDPFPASSSFSENVAAGSFWPGMHNAMESLAETVWNVLNESDSPDDAAADVAKQVKAFSNHLNNLVSELPGTVFKMEQELTKEFEGSTVSTTDNKITLNEEQQMSGTAVLKEAAAGDLDGLLDDAPAADAALEKAEAEAVVTDEASPVEKGGDEGAPKSGGSPGNPVVDNTSDTGAVSLDEGGVPAGFRKEERAVKKFEDGAFVEAFAEFLINDETKEEIFVGYIEKMTAEEIQNAPVVELTGAEATAAADETVYTDAETKLFEAMGVMVKSLTEVKDLVEKQAARIDAVEKTADEAQETADNTVVLPTAADDLGNAIQSLSGQPRIQKEAAPAADGEVVDIFKGLLPGIEGSAA